MSCSQGMTSNHFRAESLKGDYIYRCSSCSSHRLTLAMFCCRSLRAWTSCPCPMEMYRVSIFSLLPRAIMESVGSEPIDRKQIRGVRGSDSSQVFSKSRITPSVYFSPIASLMYLRAWRRWRQRGKALKQSGDRLIKRCKLKLSIIFFGFWKAAYWVNCSKAFFFPWLTLFTQQ